MKIQDLVETVKMLGNDRQLWMTNDSFNKLAEANFRLNRKNNLVFTSEEFELEITIKEEFASKCAISFARIERISEFFTGTQLRKGEIYISPKTSLKSSVIL